MARSSSPARASTASTFTRRRYAGLCALGYASGQLACNALDDPGVGGQMRRVVPTDDRSAIQAETPPPPLSGGTVMVTRDGRLAAVADEARDRLSVVDLDRAEWIGDIALPAGSRPGRVVEGAAGTAHVVLRNSGAVATLGLRELTLLHQDDVCSAPRGIAYVAEDDALHVACASGRFVTLTTDGQITRTLTLPNDLRDVVVERGNVWVSRFRSAEVLRLDASGEILERSRPPSRSSRRVAADGFSESFALFEPNVAWRMTANPSGGVVLVHQRSTTEDIDLTPPENGGSAYGGGAFACASGIQRSSVTTFDVGGKVVPGPDVSVTLPVDLALSADGRAIVLGAGREDLNAPRSSFVSVGNGPSAGFSSGPRSDGGGSLVAVLPDDPSECATTPAGLIVDPSFGGGEQYMVSVAVQPLRADSYVVQTREPAQLLVVNARGELYNGSGGDFETITLGGDSVADTGFDLFHRNAEAGISCASCHPDGTDDGHVWSFQGHGLRRTQPVDVGLAGTAPFHWDGSLREVDELMGEVFVGRMGGVHQSPGRLDALTRWLFDLRPPAPEPPLDEHQIERGRGLFESLETGCVDCHRGESLTDNNNYDVGTGKPGEKFQVPSLVGVGTRSRLIHDGCASSLRERFELPCAGGDRHGKVSQLAPSEIDDIVAYLQTL